MRLADLLPIEPEIKQALLQMRWPRERLTELTRIVTKFQG
jgi:Lon protease-like protein